MPSGWNEIPEEHKSMLAAFLRRFWSLSAWMIEAIAVLSLILGKMADFYVAAGLLVVNAVIGFLQERRAQRVVEMLQSKLQVQARVLRDGRWKDVPARELVPGDIVRLRRGDLVPADLRGLDGNADAWISLQSPEKARKSKAPR